MDQTPPRGLEYEPGGVAMRLRDKVCAITGAGRGIGRAAAELFAREGARVVIVEADEAGGREAEAAIRAAGGAAEFVRADVADAASVHACFEHIRKTHRRLDVLYNNASVYLAGQDGPVTELDPAVWGRVLAINLGGVFHCCKFGIPLMIAGGGGSVINTASSAGLVGIPNCDAYTAAKGGTIALTRSMAVEYGPRNVRVNCIAPEEVARIALFLASDDSSYLNGAVLTAGGGITICGDLAKAQSG